jgi:hypothetical protein
MYKNLYCTLVNPKLILLATSSGRQRGKTSRQHPASHIVVRQRGLVSFDEYIDLLVIVGI